jgi:hypothetical protein
VAKYVDKSVYISASPLPLGSSTDYAGVGYSSIRHIIPHVVDA